MSLNRILELRDTVFDFEREMMPNVRSIIDANQAYIVDMNATDQLFDQGINRLGVDISDYAPYSEVTVEIKKQKGQPYNRVTLYDEGDFQESFFIEAGAQSFVIRAGDGKTEELIRKYGEQILGLTDENIAQLIWDYIYPDLCDIRDNYFFGRY